MEGNILTLCLRLEAQLEWCQVLSLRMRLWMEEPAWEVIERRWGRRRKCLGKPILLKSSCLETTLPNHSNTKHNQSHHNSRFKSYSQGESFKRRCTWISIKAWRRTLLVMGLTCPLHLEWPISYLPWELIAHFSLRVEISKWETLHRLMEVVLRLAILCNKSYSSNSCC